MNRQKILIAVFCFLLMEALLIAFADLPLSVCLRNVDQSQPQIINFFRAFTDFGKSKWYLWPSGVALLVCAAVLRTPWPKEQLRLRLADAGHTLFFFFSCIAVSGLLTDVIKPLIGRARPVEMVRHQFYGFQPFSFEASFNSMPSGHTTTAVALMVILFLLFPRGRVLWFLLCGALAISRVVVNAHYLSDMVAGIAVGALTSFWIARHRDQQGKFPFLIGIFPIDKRRFST